MVPGRPGVVVSRRRRRGVWVGGVLVVVVVMVVAVVVRRRVVGAAVCAARDQAEGWKGVSWVMDSCNCKPTRHTWVVGRAQDTYKKTRKRCWKYFLIDISNFLIPSFKEITLCARIQNVRQNIS